MSNGEDLETCVSKMMASRKKADIMLDNLEGLSDGDPEVMETVRKVREMIANINSKVDEAIQMACEKTEKPIECENPDKVKKVQTSLNSLHDQYMKGLRAKTIARVHYKNDDKIYDLPVKYMEEDCPSSLWTKAWFDSNRTSAVLEIDAEIKHHDAILHYLDNNYDDVKNMKIRERGEFCKELVTLGIRFKSEVYNLIYDEYNRYGVGWGNRSIYISGDTSKRLLGYTQYLIKNNEFDAVCKDVFINTITYNPEETRILVPLEFSDNDLIMFLNKYFETNNFDTSILGNKKYAKDQLQSFLDQYHIKFDDDVMKQLTSMICI